MGHDAAGGLLVGLALPDAHAHARADDGDSDIGADSRAHSGAHCRSGELRSWGVDELGGVRSYMRWRPVGQNPCRDNSSSGLRSLLPEC
jgi:hypothetical protein